MKIFTELSKILTIKLIQNISTKEIYMYCKNVQSISKLPAALNQWNDLYPFLENLSWNEIFQLSYNIVREPYIQTFQYQVH